MAHLRSNVVIRVCRSHLPASLPGELRGSALFLKGSHTFEDGSRGHFHVQIATAGFVSPGEDDRGFFEHLREADDHHMVLALRGVAEMQSTPRTAVTSDDNYADTRAVTTLAPSYRDSLLWDAMDDASNALARVFANGREFEVYVPLKGWVRVGPDADLKTLLPYDYKDASTPGRRDRLGTTHQMARGALRGFPASFRHPRVLESSSRSF